MTEHDGPPMDPSTDEADEQQLRLARDQGAAFGRALEHMITEVADDGGEQPVGDYLVGYAVEKAEGMYEWTREGVEWRDPGDANLHVEISVRDRGDGRLVPGVGVTVTLVAPDGEEVGTHDHPLLWHPMIYHYGRNWKLPADGGYTMRVRIEPPRFMRHDEVNGKRFLEPVETEFSGVKVKRGRD